MNASDKKQIENYLKEFDSGIDIGEILLDKTPPNSQQSVINTLVLLLEKQPNNKQLQGILYGFSLLRAHQKAFRISQIESLENATSKETNKER